MAKVTIKALILSADKKTLVIKNVESWKIPEKEIDNSQDFIDNLKLFVEENIGIDISWYDIVMIDEVDSTYTYEVVLEDQNSEDIKVKTDAEYKWISEIDNPSFPLEEETRLTLISINF